MDASDRLGQEAEVTLRALVAAGGLALASPGPTS